MLNRKSFLPFLSASAVALAITACAQRSAPYSVGPNAIMIAPNGGAVAMNSVNGVDNYSCLTFRTSAESMIHSDKAVAEQAFRNNRDINTSTLEAMLKELSADESASAKVRKLSKKLKAAIVATNGNVQAAAAKLTSDPITSHEFGMVRDSLIKIATDAFGKLRHEPGTTVSCSAATDAGANADSDDAPLVFPSPLASGAPVMIAASAPTDPNGIAGVTDFDIVCNIGKASQPRVSFITYDLKANAALLGVSYVGREQSRILVNDRHFELETPAAIWYKFKKKSGYSVPAAKDGTPSSLPTYTLHETTTQRSFVWTPATDARFLHDVENAIAPAGCVKP